MNIVRQKIFCLLKKKMLNILKDSRDLHLKWTKSLCVDELAGGRGEWWVLGRVGGLGGVN